MIFVLLSLEFILPVVFLSLSGDTRSRCSNPFPSSYLGISRELITSSAMQSSRRRKIYKGNSLPCNYLLGINQPRPATLYRTKTEILQTGHWDIKANSQTSTTAVAQKTCSSQPCTSAAPTPKCSQSEWEEVSGCLAQIQLRLDVYQVRIFTDT